VVREYNHRAIQRLLIATLTCFFFVNIQYGIIPRVFVAETFMRKRSYERAVCRLSYLWEIISRPWPSCKMELIELSSWVLNKLTVAHPFKKFPTFYCSWCLLLCCKEPTSVSCLVPFPCVIPVLPISVFISSFPTAMLYGLLSTLLRVLYISPMSCILILSHWQYFIHV
jgi:hypothetical protein